MKNFELQLSLFLLTLCPLFFNATTIPFEFIDGKIIVNVNIKNNEHSFIFDSGAFTIISSELKHQLNEKKSTIIFEGIDANNVKSKMEVFSTDYIQISNLDIKNINFSFADIRWMANRTCKKISGIFGANMMKDKVWIIDFTTKTINVFEKAQKLQNTIATIPFSEQNFTNVPKINARIRNKNIEFIFDTGSGMGFTVSKKLYNKINDKDFLIFNGLLSQSLNSIIKGEGHVDKMEVEFNDTKFGNQIIDSYSDSSNLIGTKFLENYLVAIDFIDKKILLADIGKKPQYLTFGISVALIDNNLIITKKIEIPQLSEIKLMDKIIKINDIEVSKLSDSTFCKIKEILDQNFSVTIENEFHKKITLEKKDILKYLN